VFPPAHIILRVELSRKVEWISVTNEADIFSACHCGIADRAIALQCGNDAVALLQMIGSTVAFRGSDVTTCGSNVAFYDARMAPYFFLPNA
jgi:hypothetical protein